MSNDNNRDSDYIILDVGCFLSVQELKDTIKFLQYTKNKENSKNLKIVISSKLYDIIQAIIENKENYDIKEMFESWLPDFDHDNIEPLISNLKNNKDFHNLFKDLESQFEVIKGNIIDKDEASLETFKWDVNPTTKKIVYEELSLCSKFKSKIVSFGKGLKKIFTKIGNKIKEIHSSYKRKIKEHARIQSALKIFIPITSGAIISVLVSQGIISPNEIFENSLNEFVIGGLTFVLLNG